MMKKKALLATAALSATLIAVVLAGCKSDRSHVVL